MKVVVSLSLSAETAAKLDSEAYRAGETRSETAERLLKGHQRMITCVSCGCEFAERMRVRACPSCSEAVPND